MSLSSLVSSRLVSSRLVSSRLVSSRLVSSRLVLSCLVLSCLVLSCLVLSCLAVCVRCCARVLACVCWLARVLACVCVGAQHTPRSFPQERWSTTALSGTANDRRNREHVVLDLFSNFKCVRYKGFFWWTSGSRDNSAWAIHGTFSFHCKNLVRIEKRTRLLLNVRSTNQKLQTSQQIISNTLHETFTSNHEDIVFMSKRTSIHWFVYE